MATEMTPDTMTSTVKPKSMLIFSPSRSPLHDSRALRLGSYLSKGGWLVKLMWVQSSDHAVPQLPEYVETCPCIVPGRFFRDESGQTQRVIGFLRTVRAVIRTLEKDQPQLLWISGLSSLVLTAPYIMRYRNVRFVYDAREFSLGQHDYVGKKDKSFLQRLTIEATLAVEQWASRNAIAVTHTNRWRERLFEYSHPIVRQKSFVIENLHYNGLDVPSDVPSRTSIPTIGYVGALGTGRGLHLLVKSLRFLPPEYGVTIVGTGSEREKAQVLEYAREAGVARRLELMEAVPYWELQGICRTFSCGVLLIEDNCLNNRYCSPNKVFDFIAAGCPSVVTGVPSLRTLVDSFGIGVVVVEPATPQSVAAAIMKAVEDREDFRQRCALAAQTLEWLTQARTIDGVVALLGASPRQDRSGS